MFVFAATDSKNINKQIYDYCQKKKILVNVANNLKLCDFIVPALVNKGELQIAISSGGKSPALSKKIKERLANEISDDYQETLDLLGEFRTLLKNTVDDQEKRSKIFNKVAEIVEKNR